MSQRRESWEFFLRGLVLLTVLRLLWAAWVPLGADEVYYWDWARVPQLSYLDHPPAVMWLAWLSSWTLEIGLRGPITARAAIPLMFFLASCLHFSTASRLKGLLSGNGLLSREEAWWLLFLSGGIPVFAYSGVALLPDAPLYAAASLALWAALRVIEAKEWRWGDAVCLGTAFGLMGVSKYHALPLACGMAVGILYARGVLCWRDLGRWVVVVVCGALVVSPVLYWNASNDWASFRFQSAHGFAGLSWDGAAGLRTLAAQLVMLTPAVALTALLWIWRERPRWHGRGLSWNLARGLCWWAFVPLFALLESVAWFKQTLPHWVMPAAWMLVPVLCLSSERRDGAFWKWNARVSLALVMVLPWILGADATRRLILRATDHHPGAAAEVTLWPSLVRELTTHAWYQHPETWTQPSTSLLWCERPFALASTRWYWTARLAFMMPAQPLVWDLDPERPTYYRWRDRDRPREGCPVLIVADRRHWYPEKFPATLTLQDVTTLAIDDHKDMEIILARGVF